MAPHYYSLQVKDTRHILGAVPREVLASKIIAKLHIVALKTFDEPSAVELLQSGGISNGSDIYAMMRDVTPDKRWPPGLNAQ